MSTLDELQTEMRRRAIASLAANVLENNALLKRLKQRQDEWNALPRHVKLLRRAGIRIREVQWRIEVAIDVLRRGAASSWID